MLLRSYYCSYWRMFSLIYRQSWNKIYFLLAQKSFDLTVAGIVATVLLYQFCRTLGLVVATAVVVVVVVVVFVVVISRLFCSFQLLFVSVTMSSIACCCLILLFFVVTVHSLCFHVLYGRIPIR